MNSMPTNLMAQDQVRARLAEAQREQLIRVARASSPRPVGFAGSTGSFVGLLVQPVRNVVAAVNRAVHQPATGLGETATHA